MRRLQSAQTKPIRLASHRAQTAYASNGAKILPTNSPSNSPPFVLFRTGPTAIRIIPRAAKAPRAARFLYASCRRMNSCCVIAHEGLTRWLRHCAPVVSNMQ
jgi:hypothetical protein